MDSDNLDVPDQNLHLLPPPLDSSFQQSGHTSDSSNNDGDDGIVKSKQDRNKELIIEQLAKTPIVEVACRKIGIARATFYRWRIDDPEFKEKTEEALANGKMLINDLAESQLINSIQEGSEAASRYWLNHHHADYKTKIELSGNVNSSVEPLTPEQKQVIEEAIRLSSSGSTNYYSLPREQDETNTETSHGKNP